MNYIKVITLIILAFNFNGCIKEYPENRLYADGLNHGRIYDKEIKAIEIEAYEFNKERIQVLDEYFDNKAYEILKK